MIAELERRAQLDVGRHVEALAAAASGGLESGARALLSADRMSVALLTGAFIPSAECPAAETDGPAGAGMLANGLRAMGADVRLVTDIACASVVRSVGDALGVSVDVANTPEEVQTLRTRMKDNRVTHVVSVERLGPAGDGEVYNMRGEPITEYTAPLHQLLEDGAWTTIAIGDGGNELGMGGLPRSMVASHVEHGALIHCAVAADHVIVSGVSNWGAIALLLSVGVLEPAWLSRLARIASPEQHAELVKVSVDRGGAVDGTTGAAAPTVDGLGLDEHARVIKELIGAAGQDGVLRRA